MKNFLSRLSHINTGEVYLARLDTYDHYPYGLVCKGNRDYAVKDFDFSLSNEPSLFGDLICQKSGFESAQFVGTRSSYLKFINVNFGHDVRQYFKKSTQSNATPTVMKRSIKDGRKKEGQSSNASSSRKQSKTSNSSRSSNSSGSDTSR